MHFQPSHYSTLGASEELTEKEKRIARRKKRNRKAKEAKEKRMVYIVPSVIGGSVLLLGLLGLALTRKGKAKPAAVQG